MEIELHMCDHPPGNDHSLSRSVEMEQIPAHFPEVIPALDPPTLHLICNLFDLDAEISTRKCALKQSA